MCVCINNSIKCFARLVSTYYVRMNLIMIINDSVILSGRIALTNVFSS